MYCSICQNRSGRKRWARYEVTGTEASGVREGWRLYVCGTHVKRYRNQDGKYTIDTTVVETITRAIPSVLIAGMMGNIVSSIAGKNVL